MRIKWTVLTNTVKCSDGLLNRIMHENVYILYKIKTSILKYIKMNIKYI